jgi:hypothetical protein
MGSLNEVTRPRRKDMARDFQLVFMDSMDKCLETQWLYHAFGHYEEDYALEAMSN